MTSSTRFVPQRQFPIAISDSPHMTEENANWTTARLMLRRRIGLILLMTSLFILASVLLVLSMPQRYYAETRFMVSQTPVFKFAEDATGQVPRLEIGAELERFVSEDVVETVAEKLAIGELAEFNPNLNPKSGFRDALDGVSSAFKKQLLDFGIGTPLEVEHGTDDLDHVKAHFREALFVSQVGSSNVVRIGFSSRDPILAAEVPGEVVAAYLALTQSNWSSEIGVATDWLDSWIEIGRTQMKENEAAFERFRNRTALQSGDTEVAAAGRLAQIEARLTEVQRERLEIETIRRSVLAAKANPDLPPLSQTPQLLDLRKQHQLELRDLERVASIYGRNADEIALRKSRIAMILNQISKELAAQQHVLQLRDSALVMEEAQLIADTESIRATLGHLQNAGSQLANLAETLRAHDESLALLEYRKQSLLSQSSMMPINLDILTSADVPNSPEGLGRRVYVAVAAIIGFLFALLFVGIAELRDRTVRGHEQLAHINSMVPVGLWPALKAAERRRIRTDISAMADTTGPSMLRDTLLMIRCANRGEFPDVLTVTSPQRLDDKIPVAEWIAMQLVAEGHRVQFIEARERKSRNRLSATSAIINDAGEKSNFVRKSLADLAERNGRNTEKTLSALVAQAKADNMITIINAPPLLSGGGLRYARAGDAILVAFAWGRTPLVAVELAAGLLFRMVVPQVFSLIVDANPKRHRLYGFTDRLSLAHTS